MAATSNLGLAKVDSSDFVSPEPFNTNFELLDKLGLDYIVESGTSGEWWYRKWKSGRAECGIDNKAFAAGNMGAWGSATSGLYGTQQYTFGAYPFAFSSKPYVGIHFAYDKAYAGRGSMIVTYNNQSTTQSPSFCVVDPTKSKMEPVCCITVSGKYK